MALRTDVIAANGPDLGEAIEDYQLALTPPTITVRIAGRVLLEARLYQEPADVQLN